MKRIVSLIGSMVMGLFPLAVYAVTSQPNSMDAKTTWLGGPIGGIPSRIEGATLDDITSKAVDRALGNKQPVEYKTEDGKVAVQAYPDYGRSKCGLVHAKTWEDQKLTRSKVVEACNRNYELPPYAPNFQGIPHIGVR